MTIEEIKSVSIVQFLESQGYHHVYILKENYWYLSPFRTEASPSFNVSPKKNLWNDFGAGEGGNLINLVQKMNPSWNNHEVLTYLEQKIKEHHLQYSEDYEAQRKEDERKEAWKQDQVAQREKAKEASTIIERIVGLSHPYLRDYILQRRIDYDIAKEYCKEVHYRIYDKSYYAIAIIERIVGLSHPYLRDYILQRRIDYDIAKEYCKEVHYRIYDKSYYAIAFENIEGGMEARNKYSKRSIGKKSISIIRPNNEPHKECCIFEGFFDMLTYASIKRWITGNELCLPHECDYLVLNSVSNIKVLMPYLQEYSVIHCYLDNDDAGAKTVEKIKAAYQDKVINESHRYVNYKDVNDVINGIIKPPK